MRRSESLARRWGRRAVTLPGYALAATIAWSLAPVLLLVAALVDLVRGGGFPLVRALTVVLVYLAAEVVGVVASGLVWVRSLGDPAGLVARSAALQRAWAGTLFGAVRRAYGLRIEVEGAEHVQPAPFLLFVRHTSTADTVLAAAFVANPHQIVLRYVLKRELLWDPCLDIVGQRLPNTFVDRSGQHRDREIAAVAALADGLGPTDGVLVYPEGTRFSPKKLEAAKAALASRPHADLAARFEAVLPPRTGGPLALLAAAPTLDVLILEHTGFEGARSFGALARGELVGKTLRVRIRRVPRAEIPADAERWLFETWLESDAWVRAQRG